MKTFKLEIITPDGTIYSDDVESCVLPDQLGLFGVLPGHAPLICTLGPGEAKFIKDGKPAYLALSGGFAQVDPQKVAVLAETAELAHQIDVARAREQAKAKEQELKATTMISADDIIRIELSLLKELVRMKVARRLN